MTGKEILITGGCGFLGSNLAKRLLELNANITLFIKPKKSRENISQIESRLKIIEGDLSDNFVLEKVVKNKDYIFHLAWQTDLEKSMKNPKEDFSQDCGGIINLLEVCRAHNPNVKIIFTSTVTVIGDVKNIPSNELEKLNPSSVYDIHKLFAEFYLKMYFEQYNIKTCALRLSNVFGERQKIDNLSRGILNFMVGRALRGEILTVYGDGKFIRDYCYVQNYIDAFISAAFSEKTNGQVYVLGSGEGKTMNEVTEKIKEITEVLTEKKIVIEHIPFPGGEHNINKRNFIADYSKFKKDTGWYPKISFEEGLKKTIDFYIKKSN